MDVNIRWALCVWQEGYLPVRHDGHRSAARDLHVLQNGYDVVRRPVFRCSVEGPDTLRSPCRPPSILARLAALDEVPRFTIRQHVGVGDGHSLEIYDQDLNRYHLSLSVPGQLVNPRVG